MNVYPGVVERNTKFWDGFKVPDLAHARAEDDRPPWFPWPLHQGQQHAWDSMARFVAVISGTQGGKALAIETEIPTTVGLKRMGDLAVGDIVFDGNGRPTTVLYCSPVHYGRTCYRLKFDDGMEVIADAEHEWVVHSAQDRKHKRPARTLTTKEIATSVIVSRGTNFSVDVKRRFIVACEPVGSVPVKCISVDSETQQYLCTRSYIPTHNTVMGPRWLHREMRERGAGDYIAVTATYDLYKLKMLPEMRRYFEHGLGWIWQATDRILSSKHGGIRIILRSAQSEGGLESATAKAAWLDECGQDDFTLEAWEAIQRRLSIHRGRALMTTTPYNMGWLKVQVWDRWKSGNTDYEVVQFRSVDNPAFPAVEYERAKAAFPDWKFQMFYNGQFTRPAGLIYGDYIDSYREDGGHLVRPFTIPDTWMRDIGVDFGPTNEARLWVAEGLGEELGNYFVYREKLGGGLSGPEYAEEAMEYKEPVRLVLGGSRSEDERRREWQIGGCPVAEPFITDVEAGIDHVIALLRQSRFFVFDTLTRLRGELGTYSRELDAAGEPLQRIADKERYHLLDALRYIASGYSIDRPIHPVVELPRSPRAPLGLDEPEKPERWAYVQDDTKV